MGFGALNRLVRVEVGFGLGMVQGEARLLETARNLAKADLAEGDRNFAHYCYLGQKDP